MTEVEGVSELNTHRSDEPVSKSRCSSCAGVPMDTGVMYSVSSVVGVVVALPVSRRAMLSPARTLATAFSRSSVRGTPNLA